MLGTSRRTSAVAPQASTSAVTVRNGDEAATDPVDHRFESASRVQPAIDVMDVRAKCSGTDVELRRNVRGRAAFRQQAQHPGLLTGQRTDGRIALGCGELDQLAPERGRRPNERLSSLCVADVSGQMHDQHTGGLLVFPYERRDIHPDSLVSPPDGHIEIGGAGSVKNALAHITVGRADPCAEPVDAPQHVGAGLAYEIGGCAPEQPFGGFVPRSDHALSIDGKSGISCPFEQLE